MFQTAFQANAFQNNAFQVSGIPPTPTANLGGDDAWELADGVVTVSLAKAKDITKKRLRAEREPLLAAQDVAFQRAQEANTSTTAIVAEKKRLRDITTLADAATTLEGLRAIEV